MDKLELRLITDIARGLYLDPRTLQFLYNDLLKRRKRKGIMVIDFSKLVDYNPTRYHL